MDDHVPQAAYTANLDDLRFSLRAITGPPRPPEPRPVARLPPEAPSAVYEAQRAAEPRRQRWPWSRD